MHVCLYVRTHLVLPQAVEAEGGRLAVDVRGIHVAIEAEEVEVVRVERRGGGGREQELEPVVWCVVCVCGAVSRAGARGMHVWRFE